MKRNRSDSRHNSHSEDETANDGMGEDKGGGMEDLPQLVVTRANLSKMDGLLRSTLTFEVHQRSICVRVRVCNNIILLNTSYSIHMVDG